VSQLITYKTLPSGDIKIVTPEPLSGAGGQGWNDNAKVTADELETHRTDIDTVATDLATHTANTSNPHSVTKSQVGLSSVVNGLQLLAAQNLSDLLSVSTARSNLGLGSAALSATTDFAAASHTHAQSDITGLVSALSGKLAAASNLSDLTSASSARSNLGLGTAALVNTGTGNGNVPLLDSNGKLSIGVFPGIALNDTFVVASQVAMLALTAETGDLAVRTDLSKTFILKGSSASTLADWQELLTPTDAVTSVNGMSGTVILTTSDITEGSNKYYLTSRVNTDAPNVTIGTANGLSLSTQQISLAVADGANTGAMSAAHYTLVNNATDQNTASTIVKRDASGDFNAHTVNLTGSLTLSGDNAGAFNCAYNLTPDAYGLVVTAAGALNSRVYNGSTFLGRIQTNTTGIGFFGATPVAKPGSTTDLRTALINLGLYTTGGASPLDLNGGVITAVGSGLTSIPAGQLTGSVSDARLSANLSAIGGLTSAADKAIYFTGSGTASVTALTSFGRSLIDDADASTARTTLGLVTIASSGSASDLSTGTVAVARGGTGVSTFGGTNKLLYTTSTDTLSSIATANSSVLITDGSGVPSWGTTLPAVSGSALTTLNASNLSSGTVATARLGSGSASAVTFHRGDQTWAAPQTFSRVTSDVTTTDNSTGTDVTGASFAVGASETWEFEIVVNASCTDTGGIDFQFSLPTSPTSFKGFFFGSNSSRTSYANDVVTDNSWTNHYSTFNSAASSGGFCQLRIRGVIVNGANSGTVQLRVRVVNGGGAQTATVYANSFLTARRVA
jgi:hypothetical protein